MNWTWIRPFGLLAALAAVSAMAPAPTSPPVNPGAQAGASGEIKCSRLADNKRSTWNPQANRVTLDYRTDLPTTAPATSRPWLGSYETDWQAYMASVLAEVRASGADISGGRVRMPRSASWWAAPWMDYDTSGREYLNGLTKERGPDAGDIGPNSRKGPQVWAVGFYNAEGASALRQVYTDACNPTVPADWGFATGSISFKFLFTDATAKDAPYLDGAPEIDGAIDAPGSSSARLPVVRRTVQKLRLIQMDIAVRDPASPTGWVFGTYIWKGRPGQGAFEGLVPVGLQWGNDPGKTADPLGGFIDARETRLNDDLAGHVWQGADEVWPQRPFPGFQGRLNGPADNRVSSCLSCHALAQWPRSTNGLLTRTPWETLERSPEARRALVSDYMRNTRSGELAFPDEARSRPGWGGARPLDYALQVESGMSRLCSACKQGDLPGATPAVCRIEGAPAFAYVPEATCPRARNALFKLFSRRDETPLARQ
ncbi:hypothetical protein ACIQC9_06650 [Brevundimonas sp. NPDC092305]|uniref:hypothetical protein n=1 Tax=Brevundimonas sp. NPDC092305 TaxID=3363957 RepID=UPI003817D561